MVCHCQHNTCGEQCQRCCDGYVLKDGFCAGKLLEFPRVSSPTISASRDRLSSNSDSDGDGGDGNNVDGDSNS